MESVGSTVHAPGCECGFCKIGWTRPADRWKLLPYHIEFDGVPVMTTIWLVSYGEFTPERVVELLNKVTVSGIRG